MQGKVDNSIKIVGRFNTTLSIMDRITRQNKEIEDFNKTLN